MACFTYVNSAVVAPKSINPSSVPTPRSQTLSQRNPISNFNLSLISNSRHVLRLLKAKETDNNQTTKINSIVCAECNGNGAIVCTQCEGTGVNTQDHFNGQFKAGGLCWLCRGKRDILCGNCNGAGFMGGFLSTDDE